MDDFLDSSSLLDDGEALAQRLDADGYLFIKGLLPRADVLRVRARFLDAIVGDRLAEGRHGGGRRDRRSGQGLRRPAGAVRRACWAGSTATRRVMPSSSMPMS